MPEDKDQKATPAKTAPEEMQIDLGYAVDSAQAYTDDETTPFDSIHTLSLDEMIIDDDMPTDLLTESATIAEPTDDFDQAIVTLSEVVPELTPTQNADLARESDFIKDAENLAVLNAAPYSQQLPEQDSAVGIQIKKDSEAQGRPAIDPKLFNMSELLKPLPEKSDNPFLPQHILDKLNQGRKHLADDIVQSSAALDVSTAILRTQARADKLNKPQLNNNPFSARDRASKEKQKLIDDLVDEYLPLVAAELRRRLHKILEP